MSAATRARDWLRARQAAVCDVAEPWEHGTILRATRHPHYFDFNLVRVEEDPRACVDELVAVADRALDGLAHRRLDFELAEAAEPLRGGFEARGFKSVRLLMMLHATGRAPEAAVPVDEVDYDAVHDLRVAWHEEDFPGQDASAYHGEAREVAMRTGVRVLAVRERGKPVAFAELETRRDAAEITSVYVHPGRRGLGLGTAVTCAAIEAAGDAGDLWITADDEGRAKHLYARLGFAPVWTLVGFTRWPKP